MSIEVQTLGVDIGRGYVKGYSELNGKAYECKFKSIVGKGREIDFKNYKDPIYMDIKYDDDHNYEGTFCGILAEEEGFAPIRNSLDSKVTDTVKKLMGALIYKLAQGAVVNLMIGVPKRYFTKTNLKEIQEEYQGKEITVVNKINNNTKKVLINSVLIFRESDAALMYETTTNKLNNGKDFGLINIGFRTTEICFYDSNLRFIDKKSISLELGNKTVLEYVQNVHPTRKLEEIDSSSRYDDLKQEGYRSLAENIYQQTEALFINMDEVNVYVAGGLAKDLEFKKSFMVVKDPQMITSKGLFLVGRQMFK